jgi:hypothetical protein
MVFDIIFSPSTAVADQASTLFEVVVERAYDEPSKEQFE